MNAPAKTSAELEVEVEQQRNRLESRVSEIQERLSPGQLVDELLNYAKSSGGGDFVANLSRNVQANPLPIALTGIGLAWLMARSSATPAPVASDRDWDRRLADNGQSYDRGKHLGEAYPYASIKGSSLRRVQQITDGAGRRYSHFTDDAGKKFRALSDDVGNRAGHFADEAGTIYSGFTDEAGNRVSDFMDEAGNRLDDARGWASDAWDEATARFGDMGSAVADRAADLRRRASTAGAQLQDAGSQLQSNAGAMSRTVADMLHEQPLIGGALAFAVGAAIASALPTTRQEDQLVGATSDELKSKGAALAGDAYEQGKEQVADIYEQARDEAAGVYDRVKGDLKAGADGAAADANG